MTTTLDLAHAIAHAARQASSDETAAVAVLDVLHAMGAWFCRVGEDVHGCTVETPYAHPTERLAHEVQDYLLDLFDAATAEAGAPAGGGSATPAERQASESTSTVPRGLGTTTHGGGG